MLTSASFQMSSPSQGSFTCGYGFDTNFNKTLQWQWLTLAPQVLFTLTLKELLL